MQKHLFSHVHALENTHVPNGANPDAEAACEAYEASIALAGGVDLQLLGLGHNGHIGFNEPADEFTKETNCVATPRPESTIQANSRLFNSADEVPRQAYTMGIGTIMAAKQICSWSAAKTRRRSCATCSSAPSLLEVPPPSWSSTPTPSRLWTRPRSPRARIFAEEACGCGCGHDHEHGEEGCSCH